MDTVYRKVGRKYVPCGYSSIPDISDGIWLVKSEPGRRSMHSLFWRVGDLKRPADIVTHAALQSIENDLAIYMLKLGDEKSAEYKELKELCGDWVKSPVGFYNISPSDLVSVMLRRIALHLEDGEIMSWDTLQMKFRESIKTEELNKLTPVETLYKFTEWLKANNIKFRQGKNIG